MKKVEDYIGKKVRIKKHIFGLAFQTTLKENSIETIKNIEINTFSKSSGMIIHVENKGIIKKTRVYNYTNWLKDHFKIIKK